MKRDQEIKVALREVGEFELERKTEKNVPGLNPWCARLGASTPCLMGSPTRTAPVGPLSNTAHSAPLVQVRAGD